MGSSAIEHLSDADLWEQLVASGVPKDQATEQVQQRSAASRLSAQTRANTPYSARPQVGNLKGSAVAAGQGLTAGFLDELGGLAASAGGTVAGMPQIDPSRYESARDEVRRVDASYAGEHPAAHLGAELVGAIPTAAALPGGPIAGGATFGALAGAGNSNGDMSDRALNAGIGGAVGAGLGAAISSATPAAKELAGKVPKFSRFTKPTGPVMADALASEVPTVAPQASPAETRAAGLLLKRLASDNRDVGNLIADAQGRPVDEPVTLMELGGHNQNVRGLARGARSVPSKAKTEIPDALYARAQKEPVIARAALEDAAGTNAFDPAILQKALESGKKGRAKANYAEAYAEEPIADPEALAIFSDPSAPSIYRIAKRQATRDGVDLPDLAKVQSGDAPMPMQGFDYFKRGMDDYIQARQSRGKMGKNEARQLRGALSDALEKVDAQRPKYAVSRQVFSKDSQLESMVELGQNALEMDDRELARQVQAMTPNQKSVFAKSWLDAAVKKIRETGDNQDVYQKLFGNQLKRDTFKALLGDKFPQVEQAFARGSERMASKRMVLGGSNTVDKASEALDLEGGGIPDALMQLPFSPRRAVHSLGQSVLLNRLRGLTGETADALSPMLTAGSEGGPQARESLIQTLQRLRAAEVRQSAQKATTRSAGRITRPLAAVAAQRQSGQ